jgi:hypothetical protein
MTANQVMTALENGYTSPALQQQAEYYGLTAQAPQTEAGGTTGGMSALEAYRQASKNGASQEAQINTLESLVAQGKLDATTARNLGNLIVNGTVDY